MKKLYFLFTVAFLFVTGCGHFEHPGPNREAGISFFSAGQPTDSIHVSGNLEKRSLARILNTNALAKNLGYLPGTRTRVHINIKDSRPVPQPTKNTSRKRTLVPGKAARVGQAAKDGRKLPTSNFNN